MNTGKYNLERYVIENAHSFAGAIHNMSNCLNKNNNIKSYLRIRPNKNIPFMPFDIHHNQTILYDRSMYKFDYIFPPESLQSQIYEVVGK